MARGIDFAEDLAPLETSAFGPRSLTWWGVIGFMVIEATAFALAIGTYFFLASHEQTWPPEPVSPPNLLAGTLFTILLLASEIPNTMIKRAAVAADVGQIRRLLPAMIAIGGVLLVIRAFEFNSLNVRWDYNAYGSIIWALLLLHTTHILTDWIDTIVLTCLMRTPLGFEQRRLGDTDENSLYWRFVWLTWLPLYLMIYWLPRWM